MGTTEDLATQLAAVGLEGTTDTVLGAITAANIGLVDQDTDDPIVATASVSEAVILRVPGQPNDFVVGVKLSTNGWLVWRRTVRVDAAGERVTTDSQPVWVAGSIASLV